MGVLLVDGGWAVGLPRICLGSATDACDGHAMGLPWVRHGAAMGSSFVGRGSGMVLQWLLRGSATGPAGSAMNMLRLCGGYSAGMQ